MKTASHLDGTLDSFGAGIGEEHGVRETRLDQPFCQLFLPGDAIKVRGMPKLAGLLAQGGHQIWVGMTKCRNRYARPEVEVALVFLVEQIRPFATVKRDVRPVIGRKKRRNHDKLPLGQKAKRDL